MTVKGRRREGCHRSGHESSGGLSGAEAPGKVSKSDDRDSSGVVAASGFPLPRLEVGSGSPELAQRASKHCCTSAHISLTSVSPGRELNR